MEHDLKSNKENAIDSYRKAYSGDPSNAVEWYVGSEYIQHNPAVGDKKQAFIDYFSEMASSDKEIEFVRALAEGDLAAFHTHQACPGNEHYVTRDVFRFDDQGRVVEHWDSIQEVPSESEDDNPMY